ncbi:ABC transporter related protein [Leptolyngbya boryana NIES-2135]|jgi:ABC-2 type transport system ATP-binding protein|uniref:ABC transporter related protein n=1 Tax=Leptolyngbya boryana NIES-2135 TaxID=1973484 RepID=A0A1Z4JAG8_LEPBY|nr:MULTISPECIES: ATP-binding cassette domain-containing protein [Leptolyngbya]BAY53769.1 ABC transporter related protein [Leptolyngbya boryana NIES-2135]MBD2367790.1 ATP-binding cassette domain-containing protein [Leptolyngbya sp. FACHB-161]MBD2374362.1 ATP-binding cassette domain-containing protein [Leptolyngbya sp. FACHB-238]MBD2398584.1 ATP-binding cassette domain-containing protein [Leptolyngbya sp. FACHB-239]MBD2406286.1 ATP-binding cassette domain-containing protein [Leptolyngbya sp. FAC
MSSITVDRLTKVYPVAVKEAGFKGTVTHFFKRTYRQVKAVQDVSFHIEPGEVVGFLGATGAGKTTTLKMLTGLIHPSSGKVTVAGHVPFERRSSFLQKITLVMGQKQQLIWDLPAADSLRINAAVYGISDRTLKARIGELSEMLSLEGKLTQPVRKLSLGERMKCELLAALLHEPQVLFLDEPTLGLDVNAQVSVREFLKEYNAQYKATVLLTSHYMADITALCERVLMIHQGQLIYDGSLDGLVDRFSPCREVKVEFNRTYTESELSAYGYVQEVEKQSVRFLVQQEDLTQAIARILAELQVVDLAVSDPPIEEVIGRVFQAGAVI